MPRPTLLDSLIKATADLRRAGVPLPDAAYKVLDAYGVFDPVQRPLLLHEICSRLGVRGGVKAGRHARERRWQRSFHFPK